MDIVIVESISSEALQGMINEKIRELQRINHTVFEFHYQANSGTQSLYSCMIIAK